jgi:hypothetical protein
MDAYSPLNLGYLEFYLELLYKTQVEALRVMLNKDNKNQNISPKKLKQMTNDLIESITVTESFPENLLKKKCIVLNTNKPITYWYLGIYTRLYKSKP